MARWNGKSMSPQNEAADITFFVRSSSRHSITAFAAAVFLALSGNAAEAGSPIGELEYRYACTIDRQDLKLTYEFRDDPATVGIRPKGHDRPELVVNENETFKQPIELITFEYFSACQQAQRLMDLLPKIKNDPNELFNDPDWVRSLVFGSDCVAIARMRREGLLRDSQGFSTILDVLNYERAKQDYLGVPFQERADHIRKRCPF